MSEPIKIGHTPFYNFSNGDLRRANTPTIQGVICKPTVNINGVLSKEDIQNAVQGTSYQDLADRYCKVVGKYNSVVDELIEEKFTTPRLVVQEPMTLEQAIQVLNDKQFKFDGPNGDYTHAWIKDSVGDGTTLTRYITKYKDSTEHSRGDRYYDCLDTFTVIAVAEKLLREGK